jgi:glutamate synthase domain-containing protein 3
MAELGFRTMDEMIGRADCLDVEAAAAHWKASGLDLAPLLQVPDLPASVARRRVRAQDHGLDKAFDNELIARSRPALDHAAPVEFSTFIRNSDRTVGTMLGYEVTKRYGGVGLPENTIRITLTGSAGQSFGAFLPRGISLTLVGDANDGFGKGLSGGRLVAYPHRQSTFRSNENIILGNVAFYGATAGEAYVSGVAGERFCVRNSGATVVVEGVGDHGCEYMTGGRAVVLGRTGRNFAAGMSGGIAYVLDADGTFERRCNLDMVDLEPLLEAEDVNFVHVALMKHATMTRSRYAARLLDEWATLRRRMVKVMPREYKRALAAEAKRRADAMTVAVPVHAAPAMSSGASVA